MSINNKYFYCYDKALYQFIKRHGIKYITKAKHLDTGGIFVLYERSDKLHEVVQTFIQSVEKART